MTYSEKQRRNFGVVVVTVFLLPVIIKEKEWEYEEGRSLGNKNFLKIKNAQPPAYFEKIGCVTAPQGEHEYPLDVAQEISHKLFDFRQRHPDVSIILMPESSCKFSLNKYPNIIQSWLDSVLHEDCILFIGSHRTQGKYLYNCLYGISEGPIIFTYDKRQRIPFGEHVPRPWKNIKSVKNLFLNNKKKFYAGKRPCAPFILQEPVQFSCIPQICYELYFCSRDPGVAAGVASKEIPILAVSNDTWYAKTPYFQNLLLLQARYRAIEWGRPILYVAHTGGWWLGPLGEIFALKR